MVTPDESTDQNRLKFDGDGSGRRSETTGCCYYAKQATDSVKTVVNAKTNEAKDSAVAIKNQAAKDIQSDLGKAIAGQKDSTGNSGKVLETTQKNAEQTLKNTFGSLFNKKKEVKDSTKTK